MRPAEKWRCNRLSLDRQLCLVFLSVAAATVAAAQLELFKLLHDFALEHEAWDLDEIFSILIVLSGAFLALSFHRATRLRREIDRRERAEQQAHALARHDPLTGLPNRRVFAERLQRARRRCSEHGSEVTVLLIDLDRFKPVNDLYGHAAGDEVLMEIAGRLRRLTDGFREVMIARLGGDEFGCVVEHTSQADLSICLAKQVVNLVREPIFIGSAKVEVGASVGISTCSDGSLGPEELLRAADIAMYRAKRDGRSTFRIFEKSMDAELQERAALEADLREAIARGEIIPHYQPITRLPEAKLVGFEALARWNHPTRGEIKPEIFIPVAEDAGLIDELTYSILRQACADARGWPSDLSVSVNISPIQLKHQWLPSKLLQILAEGGLTPRRLIVEITESGLVSDFAAARKIIGSLKNAGVQVALDDFGTGYSSLYHLRELQFDRLKIDRSFVQNLTDLDSGKLVKAIIGLGESLGIDVTAEGIETDSALSLISDFGCNFAQGYLLGRPAAAEDISAQLSRLSATEHQLAAARRTA